jgi:hypothetical protein
MREKNYRGCPITMRYVQALSLVPTKDTWLGDAYDVRMHVLKERAANGGCTKTVVQLRAFLALEVMTTRGLVDAPLASIVRVSTLRWARSAVGITQLLKRLRKERAELTVQCAEFLLQGFSPIDPATMTNDRRTHLIAKYERVEEAALLLRRALRATTFWLKIGQIGELLAETIDHLGFEVRMNIVDELLSQNGEIGRRAWEQMT